MRSSKNPFYYHSKSNRVPWYSVQRFTSPPNIWLAVCIAVLSYFVWKKWSNRNTQVADVVSVPKPRRSMTTEEMEAFQHNEANRRQKMAQLQENFSEMSTAQVNKKRQAVIQALDNKTKTSKSIKSQDELTSYGQKVVVGCPEPEVYSDSKLNLTSAPKTAETSQDLPTRSESVTSTKIPNSSSDQLLAEQLQLVALDNIGVLESAEGGQDFISEFEFDYYTTYNRGRNLNHLKCNNFCINGINWPIVIDTGAGYSMIHERLARAGKLQKVPSEVKLSGAGGESLEILGAVKVIISTIGSEHFKVEHNVLVSTNLQGVLCILGCDFHRKYHLQIDFAKNVLSYHGTGPIEFSLES